MAEEWFRTAFGAHYPVLYAHRDEAEARRCLDLLPQLAPLERPVLDLGCGDGRHLVHLRGTGVEVVGLDLSAHLLGAARLRSGNEPGLDLVRADMRRLPFTDGSFGSVLSLFTAFGYFGSTAGNTKPIKEISRVLRGGGHWILDYFDGDRVRSELGDGRPRERARLIGPLQVDEVRELVPQGDLVKKVVTLMPREGHETAAAEVGVPAEGLVYTERVSVFTLEQLDTMAAGCGLVRVAEAGGYEGQELGSGSRWILAFQKVSDGGDRAV